MDHYNPWQSAETHRRSHVREGMTLEEILRCALFTLGMVLVFWFVWGVR